MIATPAQQLRQRCVRLKPGQKRPPPADPSCWQRRAVGGRVRWVQQAVPQWKNNGSSLLGSRPPQDPRRTGPHSVSPDGGSLKRIGELYTVEAEIRGMQTEQRLAERQQKLNHS
jgi:hypothetical protein